ncbi:MAG: branched-chain amino acid ABC transporter permease [Dehalococcoidia bacterium]
MRVQRFITPVTLFLVAFAVVALPAERSRDFEGTISFLAGFATTVGIYAIFVLALNVQWGYTGVFNFGVAAFFLVGAYTAAIVAKPPADSEFVRYIGGFGDFLSPPFLDSGQWLPFLVATAAAGLMSGLLAFLLAFPTLRLREDYLAITTIGVAELLRRVAIQEDGLVNSTRGLIGIPRPFHDYFDPGDYKFVYLAIVLGVLFLVFIAVERGIRSPWGRVLRALKEDELATAASGKDVFAFKMQGFVLGAVIMGVGGAVFAYGRGAVGPATFEHFFATFLFWAMLMVGGSGNNWGAVAGAFVVWGLWTITLQLNGYDLPDVVRSRIFFIRDFVIGALIVTVLLLRPQGLFPEERRVSIWLDRHIRRQRRLPREPASESEP